MKECTIICRVTNEQKTELEKEAKNFNYSLSELIRQKLNNNIKSENALNKVDYAFNICLLMTEIQQLKFQNPEINIENIEKGAEKLWDLLK